MLRVAVVVVLAAMPILAHIARTMVSPSFEMTMLEASKDVPESGAGQDPSVVTQMDAPGVGALNWTVVSAS